MVQATFSPAVATGLHFAMAAGLPREARATLADAVGAYGLAFASADFLLGMAVGVSACGVVAIAVGAIASHRSRVAREEQELATALGGTSERPVLVVAEQASTVQDPAEALDSLQPATAAPGASEAEPAEDEASPEEDTKPAGKHGARKSPAHMRVTALEASVSASDGPATEVEPACVEAPSDTEAASVVSTLDSIASPEAALEAEASLAEDADVSAAESTEATKAQAKHATSDYGDIAQNYVSRLSWRDRMSIRARGVQVMLAERLGMDLFEDVPVIQRADGTVGDVGTGWWDAKLGESVKRDFGDIPEVSDIDMTGVRNALISRSEMSRAKAMAGVPQVASSTVAHHVVEQPEQQAVAARIPEGYVSRVAHLALSAADRSVFITNHVPFVDAVAFPEVDVAEAEGTDLWDLAMSAMEARSGDPAALFGMGMEEQDPLHMADTPTEVLPFRPVAGHPEVVDKATYVDYLLRQELERNSSDAVRRHGRDYLRLLDGGSTSSAPTLYNIRTNRVETVASKPRHMAPASDLAELPLAV